jgi:hypothetical protein
MGQGTRPIQKRRNAVKSLEKLMTDPEHVIVIHYSCESFYDRPDGSSPRITSIAAANLHSRQTNSFSIHQIGERKGYPLIEIKAHYPELERIMLDEFYDYVRAHSGYTWLHWNMRNIQYGFQALAHRYRVLGGQPADIDDSKLEDLASLMCDMYGAKYMSHPRLQNLVEKNRISAKDFLVGADEATAFEKGEYVKLHLSTLRKVDVFATIAQRADENTLKTNATWVDIYGSYPWAIAEWLSGHWLPRILIFVFAFIGVVAAGLTIWSLLHSSH